MNDIWKRLQESIQPEYFFWAAVLCSLFFVFGPPPLLSSGETAAAVTALPVKENPFDAIPLEARAAYVYDLKSAKPLFSKNALDVLPLASITKIMTAITALDLMPETAYVTITPESIMAEGDSGLKVGERFLLRDLLKFMLVESSNDSAVAISESSGTLLATTTSNTDEVRKAFIQDMNHKAGSIGLSSMLFLNETGLDIARDRAGAYSSAADTARMLAYALEHYPSIFTETRWDEFSLTDESGEKHPARNTNTSADRLPLLIASKTGYTDLAGGNLAVAFDAGFNRPIIIVVFGSTADGRFLDVEKLVWAALEYLQTSK